MQLTECQHLHFPITNGWSESITAPWHCASAQGEGSRGSLASGRIAALAAVRVPSRGTATSQLPWAHHQHLLLSFSARPADMLWSMRSTKMVFQLKGVWCPRGSRGKEQGRLSVTGMSCGPAGLHICAWVVHAADASEDGSLDLRLIYFF